MTRQTREVLWDIYTLLLLRERLCRELGVAMKPLPMDAYGVEDEEAFVPELTDARLAKAVEECQPNTIHTTFGNHSYMKKHICKWDEGRERKLAIQLKTLLECA